MPSLFSSAADIVSGAYPILSHPSSICSSVRLGLWEDICWVIFNLKLPFLSKSCYWLVLSYYTWYQDIFVSVGVCLCDWVDCGHTLYVRVGRDVPFLFTISTLQWGICMSILIRCLCPNSWSGMFCTQKMYKINSCLVSFFQILPLSLVNFCEICNSSCGKIHPADP